MQEGVNVSMQGYEQESLNWRPSLILHCVCEQEALLSQCNSPSRSTHKYQQTVEDTCLEVTMYWTDIPYS